MAAVVATGAMKAEKRRKQLRRSSTGSFKDSDYPKTKGTVWIGQLPDTYVDGELRLSKLFGHFGKVLSCTVRQKPGYCKNWALVTFVESSAANDAVEAALKGEVTAEDSDGKRCTLVVRMAKIDAELQRNGTGALGKIWGMQNDKVAAATRIQKVVRARLMRKTAAMTALTRTNPAAHKKAQFGQQENTTARWSPQVTQVVQNHSRELANYIQWLRCERKASEPAVNRRDEILSEMRRAMRAPSQQQLVFVAGILFALLVTCVVMFGLLMGTSSELAAEKEEYAAEQVLADTKALSVGVGRCLSSAITNPAGIEYISATETTAGLPFELTVTVSSTEEMQCAGPTTVNRVVFTDFASEITKVVSCVPSESSLTPPSGLSAAEQPEPIDGVTHIFHTSVCSVAGDVLPLGNYDVQLVHAATVAPGSMALRICFLTFPLLVAVAKLY